MPVLLPAEGPILDEILSATFDIWSEGLSREAYRKYYAVQLATPWGRTHVRRWALVDDGAVLASAKAYLFDATLDGRSIRVVGLGAVFTPPAHRGRGHARVLVERLIERAATDGVDLALLFSEIGADYYAQLGFAPIATSDLTLQVVEDDRRGAPATLVRAGEERDLADIVEMGRVRAAPYRFHLDRDRDLIQFGIAKKRVLAGLGPMGDREVQFFIAEEGASAVAYVVISVRGDVGGGAMSGAEWILEEVGDRDPSGARAGAILQALIARDPVERRPTIRGWLPGEFCPLQIRITSRAQSAEVMMIRSLTPTGKPASPIDEASVLYWHGDLF